MNDGQIAFKILLISPKYPAIVVSRNELFSVYDLNTLAFALISAYPQDGKEYVQSIDSTGEEFWYYPENHILTPGFVFKRWTKKRIIDLYNHSSNANLLNEKYAHKLIPPKKLSQIIREICDLIDRA